MLCAALWLALAAAARADVQFPAPTAPTVPAPTAPKPVEQVTKPVEQAPKPAAPDKPAKK